MPTKHTRAATRGRPALHWHTWTLRRIRHCGLRLIGWGSRIWHWAAAYGLKQPRMSLELLCIELEQLHRLALPRSSVLLHMSQELPDRRSQVPMQGLLGLPHMTMHRWVPYMPSQAE